MAYSGTQVTLVTDERINVLEDYETTHARLWPEVAWQGVVSPEQLPSIPVANVSGLSQALATPTETAAPAEEPVAEPPKKAPAKKAAKPQLISSEQTIDKIAVEKDEPVAEEMDED